MLKAYAILDEVLNTVTTTNVSCTKVIVHSHNTADIFVEKTKFIVYTYTLLLGIKQTAICLIGIFIVSHTHQCISSHL